MVLGDRMQLALIDSAAHGRELPQVSGFGGRMFFFLTRLLLLFNAGRIFF